MSLTSFIKAKDIRDRFAQEFEKPRLVESRELLAPPLTKSYSMVGTAFDYLKATELALHSYTPWLQGLLPFWHPEIEFFFRKSAHRGSTRTRTHLNPDQIREERLRQIQDRPGVRVLSLISLQHIVGSDDEVRSSFRLKDCFDYALSDQCWHDSNSVPFLPLSSFITDLFMGCLFGSEKDSIIGIAEGREPKPRRPSPPDDQARIAARHVLKIRVKSTLHGADISFRR